MTETTNLDPQEDLTPAAEQALDYLKAHPELSRKIPSWASSQLSEINPLPDGQKLAQLLESGKLPKKIARIRGQEFKLILRNGFFTLLQIILLFAATVLTLYGFITTHDLKLQIFFVASGILAAFAGLYQLEQYKVNPLEPVLKILGENPEK